MSAPQTAAAPPADGAAGFLLARFRGVPIYVAPSWFLVAALITWVFADRVEAEVPGLGPWRYAVSLSFAVLLYASVLVHELSHTIVALRAGLPVRRISLYLLGGVSEIEKPARTPGVEAAIAIAGPIVSLALGAAGLLLAVALDGGTIGFLLAGALTVSNIVVGVFNLLPGLPLDGGRVVSAAVWKVSGQRSSGTVVAAWAGRVVAAVVFALPLVRGIMSDTGPDLVNVVWAALLGTFIWVGATQSLQFAKLQRRFPSLSARSLARPALEVLADVSLAEALRRAGEASAGAVVVVDADGEPLAIVNSAAALATAEERRAWIPVADVSRKIEAGAVLSLDLAGEELVDALTRAPGREHLVVDGDGRIYGVLLTGDVERAVAA